MLRHSPQSQYCFDHERKLRHLTETDKIAADICEPIAGDFVPATALTQSLTRVFRAVAEGRFNAKNATALARVATALLKSIDHSTREFRHCYRESYWHQFVRDRYNDLPDYVPPPPRYPRRNSNNSDNSDSSDS